MTGAKSQKYLSAYLINLDKNNHTFRKVIHRITKHQYVSTTLAYPLYHAHTSFYYYYYYYCFFIAKSIRSNFTVYFYFLTFIILRCIYKIHHVH
ncbi:hypothetical protein BDC45DRAFT_329455 [Circinella umbellata]|nr:hypothetical protein BDC45DRAFT_329455 [Circinella umbellata]